jgi:hypothetical protein
LFQQRRAEQQATIQAIRLVADQDHNSLIAERKQVLDLRNAAFEAANQDKLEEAKELDRNEESMTAERTTARQESLAEKLEREKEFDEEVRKLKAEIADKKLAAAEESWNSSWWSWVPFIGGAGSSYYSFSRGHYIWGTIHAASTIGDVFLIRGLIRSGLTKLAQRQLPSKLAKEGVESLAQRAASKATTRRIERDLAERFGTKNQIPSWANKRPYALEHDPSKLTTPSAAARKHVQGEYIDPLTNKVVKTTDTLAADHIFPKKLVKQLPGFDKLTKEQQAQVLNNMDNFRGLPKPMNSSKGSKTDWRTFRDQPLDPTYADDLARLQKEIRGDLQKMINDFLAGGIL